MYKRRVTYKCGTVLISRYEKKQKEIQTG